MLARAVKLQLDVLKGGAKLFVCSKSFRQQDFHSSCRHYLNNDNLPRNNKHLEDDFFDDDEEPKRHGNRFSFDEEYDSRDFRKRRYPRFGRDNYDRDFRGPKRRNAGWWENEPSSGNVTINLDNLQEFKKNFYKPHPDVTNRSQEEIREFHKTHSIQIFGKNKENCPSPVLNFNELMLPSEAMDIIRTLNFTSPTPIQSLTWPIALSGFDMVGVAQTGSGKTLGFVLPGMIHIQNQEPLGRDDGPIALIITPTRELTKQIENVIMPFSRSFLFKYASVYGGSSKILQRERLRSVEICVATPGRLIDFLSDGSTNLRRCTYCVLDEADLLMNMGFEPQIRKIMSHMRKDGQILMWSATWPKEVKDLAGSFLKDYIGVKFGSSELITCSNVTQNVIVCRRNERSHMLLDILSKIEDREGKILIFCQSQYNVEFLSDFLFKKGYRTEGIHGGKSQNFRDVAMNKFRRGQIQILVGTSVVGRGLDVKDIKNVIIYEFPNEIQEYVHIIGRTGRGGSSGTSYTLFTPDNYTLAADLVKILQENNQEVNPDLMNLTRERSKRRNYYGSYRY